MAHLCNRDIHVYKHHTGLKGLFFYLMGAKKRLALMETMKYNNKGIA
jgi:hypothetical protein